MSTSKETPDNPVTPDLIAKADATESDQPIVIPDDEMDLVFGSFLAVDPDLRPPTQPVHGPEHPDR